MKKILDIIIKKDFTKNILKVTFGTSIAQLFPLLFYPILGRIFTPAEFGLLATLSSITSILAVIATGKYESSIIITSTKKNAASIVFLVLTLSLPFLLISLIVLQAYSTKLSIWFQEPNLNKWLFICPLSAFLTIIYNCCNELCVRNKYFINLSVNKITNSAAITLSKLFLGFVKISSNGLVVGDIIGRCISSGACVIHVYKNGRTDFFQISFSHIKKLSKKYIEFPKYVMPDQLLNKIGIAVPIIIIGTYYNSMEIGYYAMTMNILSIPISIISMAIKDVFRQRANEEYIKKKNCHAIFKRLLIVLTIICVFGLTLLLPLLPIIIKLVLGEQWLATGEYSQILLPMVSLNFVSMSLNGVFIITNKMKVSMYWQLYYVIITILSLLIGVLLFNNIKSLLFCFAVGRSSAYILFIFLSYRYSK